MMAPQRGCCGLSLRTCTISLAALNLLYALNEIREMVVLELMGTSSHPEDAFEEGDFLDDLPDFSGEHPFNRSERSTRSTGDLEDGHPDEYEKELDHFQFIIMTVIWFGIPTILLLFVNVISLSVLIYGAAKSKTRCVRQWLFIGAAVAANDILNFLVFLILQVDFFYSLSILVDTPLSIWLWVTAWGLYVKCSAMDRRNAETISMAALIEEGENANDDSPCTVGYNALR